MLSLYHSIDNEIDKIESNIESLMNEVNSKVQTINGIGLESAAVIVSEIGDFTKFDRPENY